MQCTIIIKCEVYHYHLSTGSDILGNSSMARIPNSPSAIDQASKILASSESADDLLADYSIFLAESKSHPNLLGGSMRNHSNMTLTGRPLSNIPESNNEKSQSESFGTETQHVQKTLLNTVFLFTKKNIFLAFFQIFFW